MLENPLVTVVCTCFNHQKYVIESLQSVLDQTYKGIQIIVVDDCSTDDSVAIIENFILDKPEILFIKNEKNIGLTKSVNHAMTYANCDYFIDLSADDILLPHCIATQVATFKESKFENLAIVYGNAELITETGEHERFYFEVNEDLKVINQKKSGDLYAEILSMKTVICSVSAMYKKSFFDKLDGYDEQLSYEDLDYWLRISRKYTIEYVNDVLVQKRNMPNSLQSTLYSNKNKNSNSTHTILIKAFSLNKSKEEFSIMKKRVNFEMINAYRNDNYKLLFLNSWLRIKLTLKSI